jgi:hypothetical protein
VIETIAGRVALGEFFVLPQQRRWNHQRSTSGVQTWTLDRSEVPDGVSMVRVTSNPQGVFATAEGNLTTSLHGEGTSCGSLTRSELPAARDAFLDRVSVASGIDGLIDPERWRVTRLDPSQTFSVVEGFSAGDVLRGALSSFSGRAGGRAVASRFWSDHGETVALMHTKARSWSVYDKAAEYRKQKRWTPPGGLVRLESRVRPSKVNSGVWKGLTCTFALEEAVVDAVAYENEALVDALGNIAATPSLLTVRAFIRGGASPNQAYRLAAVAVVADELGWGAVVESGVPVKTVERWRAERRKYGVADGVALPDEDVAVAVRSMLGSPVLARDVAAEMPAPVGATERRSARCSAS